MRHRVDDIVDGKAISHCRHVFRIVRRVGVFQRITEIHIVVDRYNQAAVVVINTAPGGVNPVTLVSDTVVEGSKARNLGGL